EKCGGKHLNIDQNRAVQQVTVKTEFDDQILKLGEALNKTYVAYGREGKERAENQLAQDKNALKATPTGPGGPGAVPPAPVAALGRTEFKAGGLYRNSTWDLVDRMAEKDFDITKIKDEDLPEEMRKLKPEERLAYLKKKADERAELQKKIRDLSAKRQKQIDAELAKQPKSETDKALDEALKAAVRDQAKAKGFEAAAEKK